MALAAPFSIASNYSLRLARRLLSRSNHSLLGGAGSCSISTKVNCSHGVKVVSSSSLAVEKNANTSYFNQQQQQTKTTHQFRTNSSMGHSSRPPMSSSTTQTTYSALRNNVTLPFENEAAGQRGGMGRSAYTSPYSKFFDNIDAGKTSLGTTMSMEQRVLEMREQRLKCGIPESELRFRTVSYGRFALPPYVSPGEHRVTVKVALKAIPFENEQEKEIFLEIVGSRFNPKKGDLQLSSEKFASRIENKRYLVDMIEKIVLNARKLAKEFDAGDEKAAATANS